MAMDWRILTLADDAAYAAWRNAHSPGATTMLGHPVARPGKPVKSGVTPDGDDLSAAVDFVDHASNKLMMGSFVGMMAGGAAAGTTKWVGSKTGLKTLESVGGAIEKANNAKFADLGGIPLISDIGRGIGSLTQSVATAGAGILEKLGIAQWRSNANAQRYVKSSEKLGQVAEKLFAAEFTHDGVRAGMEHLHGIINVAPEAFDPAAYEKAMGDVKKLAAEKSPKLLSHLSQLDKHVTKTHGHYSTAKGWAQLSQNAAKTAENLKTTGISHGVMNTAILTGAAVSDYRTGHDLHKAMKNLRQLYADMTHQKPEDVSGTKLMFGSVPKIVAQARGQLLREFGPSLVMDAANTVLNVHFVANSKAGSMLLLMVAGMGSQLIRGVLAGSILPTYTALRNAQASGAQLGGDDYAKLIGESSRELRERGGAESNFAKVLGEVYASEKMNVADVLREVESGKMHARLEQLKAAALKDHEEKQKAKAAQKQDIPAENKAASPVHREQHTHNHVDRLQHKHKAEPRDIVGKHTEKLHKAGHDAPSAGLAI